MYTAINIFDKYIAKVGHWTVHESELDYIICESMFIAAKLEQAKKPKIENLIYDYRSLTRKILRQELLLLMEQQIIMMLGFDFNYSNPEHFIDRYLRILG